MWCHFSFRSTADHITTLRLLIENSTDSFEGTGVSQLVWCELSEGVLWRHRCMLQTDGEKCIFTISTISTRPGVSLLTGGELAGWTFSRGILNGSAFDWRRLQLWLAIETGGGWLCGVCAAKQRLHGMRLEQKWAAILFLFSDLSLVLLMKGSENLGLK